MQTDNRPVSLLDLSVVRSGSGPAQAVRDTVARAATAERLGYRRMWVAELHNNPSVAATSPEILIAAVAAATARLRVGAGGVMLPNHSPLRVAEQFRVLAALHGDRIDLGVGRGHGADARTALALRRSRTAGTGDDFLDQLGELLGYAHRLPEDHAFHGVTAMPDDVPLPELWMLGSSPRGARAAALAGLRFAYAGHLSSGLVAESVATYRHEFEPGWGLHRPFVLLSCAVIVADDDAAAERLARPYLLSLVRQEGGRPAPLPTVAEAAAHRWTTAEEEQATRLRRLVVVGDAVSAREQLEARCAEAGADELMVTTAIHDPEAELRCLELVAGAGVLALEGALTGPG